MVIVEEARRRLVVQGSLFALKVCYDHRRPAVVKDVVGIDAHSGMGIAFVVGGYPSLGPDLGEFAFALLMEQESRRVMVGAEDVRPPIFARIPDGDSRWLAMTASGP